MLISVSKCNSHAEALAQKGKKQVVFIAQTLSIAFTN